MSDSYDLNLTRSDILVWKNLKRNVNTLDSANGNASEDGNRRASGCVNGKAKKRVNGYVDANAKGHADGYVNGSANEHANPCRSLEDESTIQLLDDLNDAKSHLFQPTIFTGWDKDHLPTVLEEHLVKPYSKWAAKVVRRPTDVVFLTHILLYLATSVPSAITLYIHFTWPHAILHWLMQVYYCGSFTLMLHNHIHNRGVLAPEYALLDHTWPYILEPLMGHTWDSYYHHHVKHHHVENNGPDDLSSTLRFQRDDVFDFGLYVSRFIFLVWIELPLYFIRKGKLGLAIRTAVFELSSYAMMGFCAWYHPRAATFTLILPLVHMRFGMMVGNWGQHALVDEVDPDSDFRSSITLIDVPSNRHCFNDGYHTSHHLNPRRHWRDHPSAFIKAKSQYIDGRALTFHNIDFLMMTITLLRKDYMHLASCLIPMGEQTKMTQTEIADMLRTKTKKLSEDDIVRKYGKKKGKSHGNFHTKETMPRSFLMRFLSNITSRR